MMTHNVKISVLMAVYNGELYLNEAIDSILAQTFTDFEFLIIYDDSTDKTLEILNSYKDPRIRIIKNQENMGLTKSLNEGLKVAMGEYIARMDADDISHPLRFERQVNYMDKNPDVILCGSQKEPIGYKGFFKPGLFYHSPDTHEKIKCSLLFGCPVVHPSVMIRRSILIENRLEYNDDKLFRTAEDYELWSRLIHYGTFYILPEKLLKYRYHTENVSKQMNLDERKERNKKIIRQVFFLSEIPVTEDQLSIHINFLYACIPEGLRSMYQTFIWMIQLYLWNFRSKRFSQSVILYELNNAWISYCIYGIRRYSASKVYLLQRFINHKNI